MVELGMSIKDTGEEGHSCADIETFLLGHYKCHPTLLIGDIGGDPQHEEGPGGVPPPGVTTNIG